MLNTPFGTPARTARTARAVELKGVSPGDLRTTVQPAANAGATFRVTMPAGKFHLARFRVSVQFTAIIRVLSAFTHGVIRPQTPTGSRTTFTRNEELLCGTTSP